MNGKKIWKCFLGKKYLLGKPGYFFKNKVNNADTWKFIQDLYRTANSIVHRMV